ncbi:MAG: response regulator [Planctomycetes bacterium]|nr:response regulator [Planctomycetota bacterium]
MEADMESQPVRVLLVEDDEDDYFLTRDLLSEIQGQPFRLEWVKDYVTALEAMGRNGHEVYLLDYRLGQRNGLELLRGAREGGCQGPIILLTGQGEREVDIEAMRAGAADFLIKGQIDAALLERSLRYAIERQRDREALRQAHDHLEERVKERTVALERANEALRDREEALREAHRRKDEFLAMLAHELRNPLAPLRNALHVLAQRASADPALRQSQEMMERQVRHLARIVDDLLDVSRIMRGTIQLRPERLDLARLVRTSALDHQGIFRQAGLALDVDVPQLPVWTMGDSIRLAQVLSNLLHNAAKFTGSGGRVSVRLTVDTQQMKAEVAVRDTGIGIESEMLPRLFETFAQADRSLDRSKGGVGLGLSLVKGLAELHGGEVHAASGGPGCGAEFRVQLPVEAEPAALSEMPTAPIRTGKRLRILVVEDNRDAADSLRLLLELYGYEATVAYTGPDGVKAAEQWQPDVVLCDIGLPGLDGYGVAHKLRQNPSTAKARLIAVTGYGAEEDRRRSQEVGFDAHLVKPVDPNALQGVLLQEASA